MCAREGTPPTPLADPRENPRLIAISPLGPTSALDSACGFDAPLSPTRGSPRPLPVLGCNAGDPLPPDVDGSRPDFQRFSAIFSDFQQFSAISSNFQQLSAIFSNFQQFSAVFSDFQRFSAIPEMSSGTSLIFRNSPGEGADLWREDFRLPSRGSEYSSRRIL